MPPSPITQLHQWWMGCFLWRQGIGQAVERIPGRLPELLFACLTDCMFLFRCAGHLIARVPEEKKGGKVLKRRDKIWCVCVCDCCCVSPSFLLMPPIPPPPNHSCPNPCPWAAPCAGSPAPVQAAGHGSKPLMPLLRGIGCHCMCCVSFGNQFKPAEKRPAIFHPKIGLGSQSSFFTENSSSLILFSLTLPTFRSDRTKCIKKWHDPTDETLVESPDGLEFICILGASFIMLYCPSWVCTVLKINKIIRS